MQTKPGRGSAASRTCAQVTPARVAALLAGHGQTAAQRCAYPLQQSKPTRAPTSVCRSGCRLLGIVYWVSYTARVRHTHTAQSGSQTLGGTAARVPPGQFMRACTVCAGAVAHARKRAAATATATACRHAHQFTLCARAEYAQVLRMLGQGRLEAQCMDGIKRLCHIRGKMRKKVWVNVGDIVLLGLREYQARFGVALLCSFFAHSVLSPGLTSAAHAARPSLRTRSALVFFT
jgi:initiation factor 1A